MHAKRIRGAAQIASRGVDHLGDEPFLEFALGILVTNPFIDHFADELFEQITHGWYPVPGR